MTKAGSNGKNPGNDISGDIILPEKVEYHGVSYQIIYILAHIHSTIAVT